MTLDENTSKEDKAIFDLEDGFLLNYPDKMVFLTKEMKAHSHNMKSQHLNQFIIAHLSVETVNNYDFVDPNEVKTEAADDRDIILNIDQLIARSMKLAAAVPSEKAKLKLE